MEAMDVKYRPVVFPNGAVKKLKPAAAAVVVAAAGGESVYRECLKNHAASMGGHAVDGCGEFMPSPVANPSDPTSLKCAACGCHRNFHRRLAEGSPSPPHPVAPPVAAALPPPPGLLQGLPHRCDEREDRLPAAEGDEFDSDSDSSDYEDDRSASPPAQPVAAQQPPTYFSSAPHMLLALSSGTPAATSRLHAPVPAAPAPPPPQAAAVARKRFRTKFTSEQKQRMQELSERLGWRLQKRDEAVVEEWCRDIGVHKGVFKVWMHNNKHNFLGGHSARRSATASAAAAGANPSPPPPPSSHTSTAPPNNTTDFNINGAATTPAGDDHHHHAGGHPANGGSPQSS